MAKQGHLNSWFAHYLSEESWLIEEKGWDRGRQKVQESLFSQGNGYLGIRGILEEIPFDSQPGTFIAGLYDKTQAQVTELVNLPNPVHFRIDIEGEKLGVMAMDVLRHKRILDTRKGLLIRHTVYRSAHRQRFDYQSIRFVSMRHPNVIALRVFLTPLDGDADLTIQSMTDTSVTNQGLLTEGRKKHYIQDELASHGDIRYFSVKVFDLNLKVGYGSHLTFAYGKKRFTTLERMNVIKLKKGQTLCATKFFWVQTSRRVLPDQLKMRILRGMRHVVKQGFEHVLQEHVDAFRRRWEIADIDVKPDRDLQKALRFNLYHLLICSREADYDVSIGARTLSGEGYRGHIFWDCEIFILPFFIFTQPKIARYMLLYRYRRLQQAKKNARLRGYRGAFYPWESAETGEDVTPNWHKDLDGKIIPVLTGELEHHIVADIAYAVHQFYILTGDHRFMLEAGLEMIFETARFWASRVTYHKKRDVYEIKNVIGPDEFHVGVNNNAYTNGMAAWNLKVASEYYRQLRKRRSEAERRLLMKERLSEKEVRQWEGIAEKISLVRARDRALFSSFDGYFQKKDIPLTKRNRYAIPLFPKWLPPDKVHKTQLIKQADVVMLLYLLRSNFSSEEKRANFNYYDKRTVHKSSLSSAIHAIMALQAGQRRRGYRYFLFSLYADLQDFHHNTLGGVHAASVGGTWQIMICGFCGLDISDRCLYFNPSLPKKIREIRFKMFFHGTLLSVSVQDERVRIETLVKGGRRFNVSAFGKTRELLSQKQLIFRSKMQKVEVT
ncbi:MAG: glycosyl hydrolase family 65 protein [Candidatus Omnitrophota bacterium]